MIAGLGIQAIVGYGYPYPVRPRTRRRYKNKIPLNKTKVES